MMSENSLIGSGLDMIFFRPGSQVWQLVTVLSVVGEFPIHSLSLLGNKRVYRTLIHKLTSPQRFRDSHTGMELSCRLFTISGKGRLKSVRLYKGALPILKWIHPEAYQYYMEAFSQHRFPGDSAHRERNHRFAETVALCMRAGIEARPYLLTRLQSKTQISITANEGFYYPAKEIKKTGEIERNKTMFTRMTGAVFYPGGCYAVYNTRAAVMRWNGMGEFKALYHLMEIGRLNTELSRIDSAVLLGISNEIALKTLLESDKSRRLEFRFDSIYQHVYFISMDEDGIRQLRLLSIPNWQEKQLDLLFEPDSRSFDRGIFEYDACVNGAYILSYLDGDIARLLRFRDGIQNRSGKFEILCFPHQTQFLREYMGQLVTIKTIDMSIVETELGFGRRDLLRG